MEPKIYVHNSPHSYLNWWLLTVGELLLTHFTPQRKLKRHFNAVSRFCVILKHLPFDRVRVKCHLIRYIFWERIKRRTKHINISMNTAYK
jgi:hypothetical protein